MDIDRVIDRVEELEQLFKQGPELEKQLQAGKIAHDKYLKDAEAIIEKIYKLADKCTEEEWDKFIDRRGPEFQKQAVIMLKKLLVKMKANKARDRQ